MSKNLVNQFVVETTVRHPGIANYYIYSTREGMQSLAEALAEGLQRASQPQALWCGSVTTAYGSLYGNTLTFRLSEDLAHFRSPRRFFFWVKLACWFVFIALAGFGVEAIATGFIPVSPVVRDILLGVPLLGLAIGLLWLRDAVSHSRRA